MIKVLVEFNDGNEVRKRKLSVPKGAGVVENLRIECRAKFGVSVEHRCRIELWDGTDGEWLEPDDEDVVQGSRLRLLVSKAGQNYGSCETLLL